MQCNENGITVKSTQFSDFIHTQRHTHKPQRQSLGHNAERNEMNQGQDSV